MSQHIATVHRYPDDDNFYLGDDNNWHHYKSRYGLYWTPVGQNNPIPPKRFNSPKEAKDAAMKYIQAQDQGAFCPSYTAHVHRYRPV